jgi:hypothetical protein
VVENWWNNYRADKEQGSSRKNQRQSA